MTGVKFTPVFYCLHFISSSIQLQNSSSMITPGTPNTPTVTALTRFSGIIRPTPHPTAFSITKRTPPSRPFTIIFKTIFSGISRVLPKRNNNIKVPPKVKNTPISTLISLSSTKSFLCCIKYVPVE